MTDDLIARLRAFARDDDDIPISVADEAADLIEQLQALNRAAGLEIERLRGCLISLPDVKLQDQFGNSWPAYTKLPHPS